MIRYLRCQFILGNCWLWSRKKLSPEAVTAVFKEFLASSRTDLFAAFVRPSIALTRAFAFRSWALRLKSFCEVKHHQWIPEPRMISQSLPLFSIDQNLFSLFPLIPSWQEIFGYFQIEHHYVPTFWQPIPGCCTFWFWPRIKYKKKHEKILN